MERVMSVEERIRRAEDIYNRRNGGYSKVIPSKDEKEKKNKKGRVKKLLMQMFVCLLVYIVFYAVSNRNHVFSEEFRNEVGSFLNEKTKISELYINTKLFIQSKFDELNSKMNDREDSKEADEANADETEKSKANKEDVTNNEKQEEKKDDNIGGAIEGSEKQSEKQDEKQNDKNKEEKKNEEEKKVENLSEQQLMEKEAKEIKSKISFITPVKGRISSTFGWRNPTTATVPKYHTGLDIAVNEGTKIKSATDGKVIMASKEGDYGNHYQIQIEDVIIVYAHCKKLYLKEGDSVKQGQEIAEVGSTGNSTGPHLHFEIRRNGKKIDPQLIIKI